MGTRGVGQTDTGGQQQSLENVGPCYAPRSLGAKVANAVGRSDSSRGKGKVPDEERIFGVGCVDRFDGVIFMLLVQLVTSQACRLRQSIAWVFPVWSPYVVSKSAAQLSVSSAAGIQHTRDPGKVQECISGVWFCSFSKIPLQQRPLQQLPLLQLSRPSPILLRQRTRPSALR